MTEYNIRLNPNCASVVHTGLKFKSGDKGITLKIAVDELDTTDTAAKIVFLRANGTSVESDITGTDGVYTYKTLGNEFAVPGKTVADVKFYASEERVSTASFVFEVCGDTIDGIGSGTGGYSDQLEKLVAEAEAAENNLKETEAEMAAVLQDFKEQYGESGALNPRGDWNNENTYQIRDVVYYNSSSWISLVGDNNMEPSDENKTYWMKSTDLESIINGTTVVGKANDADTVDGLHAEEVGVSGARNMVPYPYYHTTRTESGITWTDNGDGTITVNGTASATSVFVLKTINSANDLKLRAGSYTVSGATDNTNGVCIALYNGSTLVSTKTTNNGTFTISKEESAYSVRIYARVMNGQKVENAVFKPMLECGSVAHDYMPYYFGGAKDADTLDGKHASDFFPVTGGRVEGVVSFRNANNGYGSLYKNNSTTADSGTFLNDVDANGKIMRLLLTAKSMKAYFGRDGVLSEILDTGNMKSHVLPLDGSDTSEVGRANGVPLVVATTVSGAKTAVVGFKNSTDGVMGHLGMLGKDIPCFINSDKSKVNTLLHTGNSQKVVTSASAPSDTSALWVDTTNKKVKAYIDGAWTAMA